MANIPEWVIEDARYVEGYKIEMWFADGLQKIIDLEPELHGKLFEPLKDPDYFRQVQFSKELGTIFWPNDADIAPEHLYEIAKHGYCPICKPSL